MEPATPIRAGLFGSIRALGDGILGGLQERIALLGIELQEEKFRLVRLYMWVNAVLFAGAMAMVFASLLLVYLFWERARLAVLAGLAGFFGLALVVILFAFRSYLRRQPAPFAATLQEIGKDRACILNET